MDLRLSSSYSLLGNVEESIRTNAEAAVRLEAAQLVVTTWITLCSLVDSGKGASEDSPSIVLGEPLAEKLFMNLLDIFSRLGDSQMLGMLACLLEMDRRSRRQSSTVTEH